VCVCAASAFRSFQFIYRRMCVFAFACAPASVQSGRKMDNNYNHRLLWMQTAGAKPSGNQRIYLYYSRICDCFERNFTANCGWYHFYLAARGSLFCIATGSNVPCINTKNPFMLQDMEQLMGSAFATLSKLLSRFFTLVKNTRSLS
jgi:hypothetical protein